MEKEKEVFESDVKDSKFAIISKNEKFYEELVGILDQAKEKLTENFDFGNTIFNSILKTKTQE